jgi:hypothetical protein
VSPRNWRNRGSGVVQFGDRYASVPTDRGAGRNRANARSKTRNGLTFTAGSDTVRKPGFSVPRSGPVWVSEADLPTTSTESPFVPRFRTYRGIAANGRSGPRTDMTIILASPETLRSPGHCR